MLNIHAQHKENKEDQANKPEQKPQYIDAQQP